MCFVSVKSMQQQATLMLRAAPRRPPTSALGARRGVRDQLMGQRTATINALRGHLTEFGIVASKRRGGVRQLLELMADAEDERIPPLARELLQTLVSHLRELEARIAELDGRLVKVAHSDPIARMLDEIPGVGPVIATAFAATVVDPGAFASGRHLSASIGLVPAQHASGGKQRQLGISKRGDGYLRRQLIHGARSPVRIGGVGRQAPYRRAVDLDQGAAGAPPLQRRRGGGGQQVGAHHLGDAGARRGLPGRLRPPAGADQDRLPPAARATTT
jgi:transposase